MQVLKGYKSEAEHSGVTSCGQENLAWLDGWVHGQGLIIGMRLWLSQKVSQSQKPDCAPNITKYIKINIFSASKFYSPQTSDLL